MVKYRSVSNQVLPASQCSCKTLPKSLCYSLIAAVCVILCGLVATTWAWNRYHYFSQIHRDHLDRSDKTVLYLGPALSVFGVICLIIVSIIIKVYLNKKSVTAQLLKHEGMQDSSSSHELQYQHV